MSGNNSNLSQFSTRTTTQLPSNISIQIRRPMPSNVTCPHCQTVLPQTSRYGWTLSSSAAQSALNSSRLLPSNETRDQAGDYTGVIVNRSHILLHTEPRLE